MTGANRLDDKVRDLRAEFDRAFAISVAERRGDDHLNFLGIRLGADPYALRLSEVASLHADRRPVSVPSALPELLGIAGFRGVLTPVYDLARLVGYDGSAPTRWLIVAHWPSPVAFAFEAFEAHLRVPASDVVEGSVGGRAGMHGAVLRGQAVLPILSLSSLVEGIAQRINALRAAQER